MKVYRTDKIIKREHLRAHPDILYLFGDNDIRVGLGGQAKEMRGQPNAIGISTKKAPCMGENSFKTDSEYATNILIMKEDFDKVYKEVETGKYKTLVIPQIGIGLAKLDVKAPLTYKFLQECLQQLHNYCVSNLTLKDIK